MQYTKHLFSPLLLLFISLNYCEEKEEETSKILDFCEEKKDKEDYTQCYIYFVKNINGVNKLFCQERYQLSKESIQTLEYLSKNGAIRNDVLEGKIYSQNYSCKVPNASYELMEAIALLCNKDQK